VGQSARGTRRETGNVRLAVIRRREGRAPRAVETSIAAILLVAAGRRVVGTPAAAAE